MKIAVLASLAVSAAAFAPFKLATRSGSTLAAKPFEDEIGAMAPLGFFDPLGLVEDGDAEKFERLRTAELKHGRIAMLAVVGYLYTLAGNRLPGMGDVGSGFSAFDVSGLSPEVRGVFPLTLACFMLLELGVMQDKTGEAEFPGDYRNGFIDFGWDKQSDEWKKKKRTIELNNGRAAQMGILGIMVHEQLGNLKDIGVPPF